MFRLCNYQSVITYFGFYESWILEEEACCRHLGRTISINNIYLLCSRRRMITIVGGGPVGCYAAGLLTRQGEQVTVLEEHKSVGKPVQCTGIVTDNLKKHVDIRKGFVINKTRQIRIYSPAGKVMALELRKPDLVIDRTLFDRHIAGKAMDLGAEIKTGARFIRLEGKQIVVRHSGELKKSPFSSLVGADGPLSAVARSCGIFGNRRFWHGVQARIRVENDNAVDFFPHIGTFAWMVPEDSRTARVGVLASKDLRSHFRMLIRRYGGKVLEYQGGIVPIYDENVKTVSDERAAFLVGDAACQVKATTGGGIVPGLAAAGALADSLLKGRGYEKEWRKRIGRELWVSLIIRKALDKFSENDQEKLVRLC
ncbi:geranylgeranyl reductase family protein, partial [Candidatus Woesearchaeota archaeon]|nr:geranylgeranyl reductase family protein [Candidatus Woesearchaeota archaeon]